MKLINSKRWKIKSTHNMGGTITHIIECVENPSDIRRISYNGWNEYPDANN